MVRVTGWRALGLLLVTAAVALAVMLTVLWAAAALAVLGVVLWLNVGVIPRLAWRLGVSRWVMDVLVLVALCAGGRLLGGVNGTTAGAVVWLGGIGAPRVVGAWLRRKVRIHAASGRHIIEGVAHEPPNPTQLPERLPGPSE